MIGMRIAYSSLLPYYEMNEMLSFYKQAPQLDYIFTTSQLNEIIWQQYDDEITEHALDESFEIDVIQINKIYQCL